MVLQYVIKDNRRWDLIAKVYNNRSKDQAKARYHELKTNPGFHISID